MNRQIRCVIQKVQTADPTIVVEQLQAKHPADDAGLWFFRRGGINTEVQIESPDGACPFLIEASHRAERINVNTVDKAAAVVLQWLHHDA